MTTSDTPVFQTFHLQGVKHISPENAFRELQDGNALMIDVPEEDEYVIEFISLNDVYHFPMSSIMDNLKNIPYRNGNQQRGTAAYFY